MHKRIEQFRQQENNPEEFYKTGLFKKLVTEAEKEISEISSPKKMWQLQAELVEAITLSGDIKSAKSEAEKIPINGKYAEYLSDALISIITRLAKENPDKALELVPDILEEDMQVVALFEVLRAVSGKWDLEKIQELADKITETHLLYYQIEATLLVIEVMATKGQIELARQKVQQDLGLENQFRGYLLIYKSSQLSEDIEAARKLVEKSEYKPWEKWLRVAEVTRDPRDIAAARLEIDKIRDDVNKGKQQSYFLESALIELAKITSSTEDVRVAREALIASGEQSLLMELARLTRNDIDIELLRKSGEDPSEHFDALATIAGITRKEADFQVAYNAAKKLRTTEISSGRYLRAYALIQLAQVLEGKILES